MSLRNPLGRARGLGAAKDGTEHWWAQRLTAIALVPLSLAFVALLIAFQGLDQAGIIALMGNPLVAIIMIMFVVAGFYHMQIGVKIVIEDYVHHLGMKTTLLIILTLGTIALGAVALFAILKLAFTG